MKAKLRAVFATTLVAMFSIASLVIAQSNQGLDGARAPSLAGIAMSQANPSRQDCEARRNDTAEKLLECMQAADLWSHLSDFQKISDQNPGPDGHGNRDTGTKGYLASVQYLAALMRKAGYRVTIQLYPYTTSEVVGVPQFQTSAQSYATTRDWFVARLSGGGTLTATVQTVGGSGSGCSTEDFAGFASGHVALLQSGACTYDLQVENAADDGAVAVILYNGKGAEQGGEGVSPGARNGGGAFQARLTRAAKIPVVGVASYAVGSDLERQCASGHAPVVHLDIRTQQKAGTDYNLIAESSFGDPNKIVVVEAHLDSIFGAGMLDNASGSTTALEIALNMAKTPTRNRLRYVWFGGEEIGLLGSDYYTKHLSSAELRRIVFDLDIDVTATPNFDYLVADPAFASNVRHFPKNVVPGSKVGNQFLRDFFKTSGVPSRSASFGNDGTDSNSFSLVGIPNTGILTQQDCCKSAGEVKIWGGVRGNYEGKIPSFDGGCVDNPGLWCDNLSNNDPAVFALASKAAAYVALQLSNFPFLK